MANYKMDRTSEDILRELTAILRRVKDPRVSGMISIVRVEVSNDMSYAKVYISAMEGMDTAKEAVQGLKSASGFIKRELSARIRMRRCPELHFIADDSIEHSAQLNQLIDELNHKG